MVEAGLFRVCRPATGWRLRTQPSHPVRYGHCGVAGAPLRRLDSDGDRRASLLPRRSGRARAGGGFGDRHGGLVLGTPAWQQAESSALTWYAFAGQVTVGFSVTFRAWRPRTNCQRHDLRGYRRDASPPTWRRCARDVGKENSLRRTRGAGDKVYGHPHRAFESSVRYGNRVRATLLLVEAEESRIFGWYRSRKRIAKPAVAAALRILI
jgi:hypothetical protein